jgi:hypothetical protein
MDAGAVFFAGVTVFLFVAAAFAGAFGAVAFFAGVAFDLVAGFAGTAFFGAAVFLGAAAGFFGADLAVSGLCPSC